MSTLIFVFDLGYEDGPYGSIYIRPYTPQKRIQINRITKEDYFIGDVRVKPEELRDIFNHNKIEDIVEIYDYYDLYDLDEEVKLKAAWDKKVHSLRYAAPGKHQFSRKLPAYQLAGKTGPPLPCRPDDNVLFVIVPYSRGDVIKYVIPYQDYMKLAAHLAIFKTDENIKEKQRVADYLRPWIVDATLYDIFTHYGIVDYLQTESDEEHPIDFGYDPVSKLGR